MARAKFAGPKPGPAALEARAHRLDGHTEARRDLPGLQVLVEAQHQDVAVVRLESEQGLDDAMPDLLAREDLGRLRRHADGDRLRLVPPSAGVLAVGADGLVADDPAQPGPSRVGTRGAALQGGDPDVLREILGAVVSEEGSCQPLHQRLVRQEHVDRRSGQLVRRSLGRWLHAARAGRGHGGALHEHVG